MDLDLLRGSLNPKNFFDILKYRFRFAKENPDYFYPERFVSFLWWSRFWKDT